MAMLAEDAMEGINPDFNKVAKNILEGTYGVTNSFATSLLEKMILKYVKNNLSFNLDGDIKSLILDVSKENGVELDELYILFNMKRTSGAIHELEKSIMRELMDLGYPITLEDIYEDSRRN